MKHQLATQLEDRIARCHAADVDNIATTLIHAKMHLLVLGNVVGVVVGLL